jgi:hypothetical protein
MSMASLLRSEGHGLAARFDMSLPENQRKLEPVERLAQVADTSYGEQGLAPL